MNKFSVYLSLIISFGMLNVSGQTKSTQAKKPNIIVFLVDDLGWSDLGCYGNAYNQTPNIDKLAADGIRFTNAYASSLCTATRASIMTGVYPGRSLLTNWNPAGRWDRTGNRLKEARHIKTLPLETITLPEAMKEHNYTTAIIGKWQLGGPPFGAPEQHGFDINKGGGDFGAGNYFYPYVARWKVPTTDDYAEYQVFKTGKKGEYLTDRLTEETEKFIRGHKEKPFFLYLSHFGVHAPYQAKKEKLAKYESIPESERTGIPEYAAMIESIDESLGSVVALLEELNLDENTLILFTSDNGGSFYPTNNTPLKAGKGSEYEGGIRVPFIAKWLGKIKGGIENDTPIICNDIYPTALDAAKLPLLPNHHEDGLSLMPLLTGEAKTLDRDALYWHNPHYNVHPYSAPVGVVRKGDWKLMEFYESGTFELYNLKNDIAESNNLIEKEPQIAIQLKQDLENWRQSVDAEMMSINPDFVRPGTGLYGARVKPFYDDNGVLKFTLHKIYNSFSHYITFDGSVPDDSSQLYKYGTEIEVPENTKEIKLITYQNNKNTGKLITFSRKDLEQIAKQKMNKLIKKDIKG